VTLRRDGTLDVTILKVHHGIFEEISSKGIQKLGGDDIDVELARHLGQRFQQQHGFDILNSPYRQRFLLAVEQAKIQLSSEPLVVVRKAEIVPERHLSLEEEIDRTTFERVIMPLVVKSGEAIDEALRLRGLRPRDIDRILLVGGTSKIPLVKRFVAEKLANKEPESFDRVDPMTCVAQGAAIVSAILQHAPGLDNCAYSVKLEHSLCANPMNEQRKVYLDPIIRRGSDIPCSQTKKYYPVADPADRVVISVYEGDNYDEPDSPENVRLAEIPWEFEPPRPQRDGELEVTFEYGDDGILTVQISDMYSSQKKRFAIQQTGDGQLDPAQVDRL
jgi:molecular chaperone DnaK